MKELRYSQNRINFFFMLPKLTHNFNVMRVLLKCGGPEQGQINTYIGLAYNTTLKSLQHQ